MSSIFDDDSDDDVSPPIAAAAADAVLTEEAAADERGSVKRKASEIEESRPAAAAAGEAGLEATADADAAESGGEEKGEEEDEEEDEDEGGSGSESERRPKKARIENLIDAMAEDDEDEDEDEEGEDGGEDLADLIDNKDAGKTETEGERRKRMRAMREVMAADNIDMDEVAREAAEVERRHKAQRARRVATDSTAQYIRPLPTPADPKLFMCKVRDTKERIAQIQLLRKCHANPQFKILSVVDRGTKGHLYIEAFQETYVKAAVEGLEHFRIYAKGGIVPLVVGEMTKILAIPRNITTKPVKKGDWVRYRRAPYKDDLAQVMKVAESGAKVVIRMFPRLDLAASRAALAAGRKAAKKKGKNAIRPQQALFDVETVKEALGLSPDSDLERKRYPETGDDMYFFENDYFDAKGFIVKSSSGDKMAEPSLEEQAKFVRAAGDGTADARQVFTNLIKARAKTRRASQKLGAFALRKGDIVVPNEGDLENLKGVVMSVNTVEGTVSVKHAELPDEQEYDIKHLSRSIQEGEHVKVVRGAYEGETGNVVQVKRVGNSQQATVISDRSGKELDVFVDDIQISTEVARGLDSLNGFELYDLIALPGRNVGVVVHVGSETLTVLQQTGAVENFAPTAIQGKMNFNSARSLATGKKHKQMREGDRVRLVVGTNAGKEGTVRRIHRTFLFVHISQEQSNNSGISVIRARCAERLGGTAGGNISATEGIVISSASVSAHRGGRRRGGGANDDIVGKMVRITKGNMKGYLGRVVSANSNKARVKFQSKPRPLSFALAQIQRVDKEELMKHSSRVAPSSGSGASAGAYGAGGLTPMISNMGSSSPGMGMTPQGGVGTPYLSHTPSGVGGTPSGGAGASGYDHESAAWDPALTGTPMLQRMLQQQQDELAFRPDSVEGSSVGGSSVTGVSSAYSVSTGYAGSAMGGTGSGATTPGSSYSVSAAGSGVGDGASSYGSYISSTSEWSTGTGQTGGAGGTTPQSSGAASVGGESGASGRESRWGSSAGAVPPPPAPEDQTGPSFDIKYNWIQRGLVLHGTCSTGEEVIGSVIGRENNICRLKLRGDTGELAQVTDWTTLRPVVPKKKEKVKIVAGEFKGLVGELINIDGADGIVKMVDLDIQIVDMNDLAAME